MKKICCCFACLFNLVVCITIAFTTWKIAQFWNSKSSARQDISSAR